MKKWTFLCTSSVLARCQFPITWDHLGCTFYQTHTESLNRSTLLVNKQKINNKTYMWRIENPFWKSDNKTDHFAVNVIRKIITTCVTQNYNSSNAMFAFTRFSRFPLTTLNILLNVNCNNNYSPISNIYALNFISHSKKSGQFETDPRTTACNLTHCVLFEFGRNAGNLCTNRDKGAQFPFNVFNMRL